MTSKTVFFFFFRVDLIWREKKNTGVFLTVDLSWRRILSFFFWFDLNWRMTHFREEGEEKSGRGVGKKRGERGREEKRRGERRRKEGERREKRGRRGGVTRSVAYTANTH